MQTIKESFKTIAVSFAVFFLIGIAHAWTEPATNPPSGNTVPPISTAGGQIVEGGLVLGNSTVPNGLIVKTGNVGIGITDPKVKLDISGTTRIDTPTYIPSSSSLVANYTATGPVKDIGIEAYGKTNGVMGASPLSGGYGVTGTGASYGVFGRSPYIGVGGMGDGAGSFGGYFSRGAPGQGQGLYAESLCLGTITNCKSDWPASGTGTVISITAGSGLSGGTINTSGTISLNTANTNTWSGAQTFSADTNFPGSGIWNSSGNVGIGTIYPGTWKLNVAGNTNIGGNLNVTDEFTSTFNKWYGGSYDRGNSNTNLNGFWNTAVMCEDGRYVCGLQGREQPGYGLINFKVFCCRL